MENRVLLVSLLMFLEFSRSSLSSSSSSSSSLSIHQLLRENGLPGGLFPEGVKSYSVSEQGLLEVVLDGTCLTKFDTISFYESVIRGNLTYGGLTGVEGLSQEELFLWVPVKDIILDNPRSGLIMFDIGLAQKHLSLSLFEDPPHCNNPEQLIRDLGGGGGGGGGEGGGKFIVKKKKNKWRRPEGERILPIKAKDIGWW